VIGGLAQYGKRIRHFIKPYLAGDQSADIKTPIGDPVQAFHKFRNGITQHKLDGQFLVDTDQRANMIGLQADAYNDDPRVAGRLEKYSVEYARHTDTLKHDDIFWTVEFWL